MIYISNMKALEAILEEASTLVEEQFKYEDVVIILGSKNSGKNEFFECTTNEGTLDSDNLLTKDKCDLAPVRLENQEIFPNLVFWDMPIININKYSAHDVIKIYWYSQMFKRVKSIKFVLVINHDDFTTDPLKTFITLIDHLASLLKNKIRNYFSNITVLFTAIPDIPSIACKLAYLNQITSNDRFKIANEFINYLLANDQICMMTSKEFTWTHEFNVETIKNLNSLQKRTLELLAPDIIKNSKIFQDYIMCSYLQSTFSLSKNLVRVIYNSVKDILKCELKRYCEIEKLTTCSIALCSIQHNINNFITRIQKIIDLEPNFYKIIYSLQMVDPRIKNKIKTLNLLEISMYKKLTDNLFDQKESELFAKNIQYILETKIPFFKLILDNINNKMELSKIPFLKFPFVKNSERFDKNSEEINARTFQDINNHRKKDENDLQKKSNQTFFSRPKEELEYARQIITESRKESLKKSTKGNKLADDLQKKYNETKNELINVKQELKDARQIITELREKLLKKSEKDDELVDDLQKKYNQTKDELNNVKQEFDDARQIITELHEELLNKSEKEDELADYKIQINLQQAMMKNKIQSEVNSFIAFSELEIEAKQLLELRDEIMKKFGNK